MKMFQLVIFFLSILTVSHIDAHPKLTNTHDYVTVRLSGQFGNQLFELATAYAYALDHGLQLVVPDLVNKKDEGVPHNAKIVFLHTISCYTPKAPPSLSWREPNYNYTHIPNAQRIELAGYFQSEKYFAHRRQELLELFKVPPVILTAITNKYPFLNTNQFVVGIQIRDYRQIAPTGAHHPTLGRKYYERAISFFPRDSLFIVSSNNQQFARQCLDGLAPNLVYLNADYIEEFYTLTMCKSFIISNSSFGWWASWLSTANGKRVIAPNLWFAPPYDNMTMTRDLIPEYYQIVNAE